MAAEPSLAHIVDGEASESDDDDTITSDHSTPEHRQNIYSREANSVSVFFTSGYAPIEWTLGTRQIVSFQSLVKSAAYQKYFLPLDAVSYDFS